MVNTGLRPDEAGRLQFRDVEVVKDAGSKETILEISVRGKRGVGYCKSMPGAVVPFRAAMQARKRLADPGNRESLKEVLGWHQDDGQRPDPAQADGPAVP